MNKASKSQAATYVIGRKNFEAITAVEGLSLTEAGRQRLRRTASLPADQRRAETLRAYRLSQVK